MSQYSKKKQAIAQEKSDPFLPTVKEIQEDWPCATRSAFPDRNILDEVYSYYDVRMGIDTESGSRYRWVAFPVTKKGKLSGYILNDTLSNTKYEKWRTAGDVDVSCDLVGMYNSKGERLGSRGTKKIFVAEGMYDFLSIFQTLYYLQRQPGKYTPDAVSIGLGTVNAVDHIAANQTELLRYDQFITVFDEDQCTEAQLKKGDVRGKEATEVVHRQYPQISYHCKLDIDTDPNDYVARRYGLTPKRLNTILWDVRVFKPDEIVDMASVKLRNPKDNVIEQGVIVPEFPKLSKDMEGFRDNNLILLIAPPKSGKSTVARTVQAAFIDQGLPSTAVYFEKGFDEEPVYQYIAHDQSIPYADWMFGSVQISNEKMKESRDKLKGHTLINFKGSVTIEDVLLTIRKEAISGKRLAIVDHGSWLVEGKKNMLDLISQLCQGLAEIKKQYPICILLIAHITIDKRQLDNLKRKYTTKDSNEWDLPFWHRLSAHDARGGSGWLQVCDIAIVVDKEYLPDDTMGDTQLKVTDDRLVRCTGRKDVLGLDNVTGKPYAKGRTY